MWCTQLDRHKQLLRDLLEDRRHGFPCDCGACIYAAYLEKTRAEGRHYSKRTFFVYFLRTDFFAATEFDRRFWKGSYQPFNFKSVFDKEKRPGQFYWQSKLSEIIARWRKDDWKSIGKKNLRLIRSSVVDDSGVYFYHALNLYADKVRSISRTRTLARIKKLAREEKNESARAFLQGILNKKSFYTYYRRAGNSDLFKIVNEGRIRIHSRPGLRPAGRPPIYFLARGS